MVEYAQQIKNCVFMFFNYFQRHLLHGTRQVNYSNIDLTVKLMKYESRYNMQTVLVVKSSRADVLELTLQPCWQINEQEQVGIEEMIMHFLCS